MIFLKQNLENKKENFSNGRMVRHVYDDLVMNHARRVVNIQNITKEELEALAKESSRVQEFTEGKQIVKVIYVPGKLVNIVVK